MRNKPDLDELSMDDLYNNLKVYEAKIKSQSSSNSNSHNVAFVSSENTSSTNEAVNTALDIMKTWSRLIQMILKRWILNGRWNVTTATRNVTLLETAKHQGIRGIGMEIMREKVVPVETSANALVVQDGIGGYDWSFQDEDGPTNFALMPYTSQSSSSSDNKVHTCSKNCLKSFEALQKQYDQQREALNKSSLEIIVYNKSIRFSAPIIEDWESNNKDENVFEPKEVKKTVKSSFENIEFVNARNSTVEKPRKFSQNPRDNKRNRNSFEFTKKACFVCGSFNHLIKDSVATKSGQVPVNAAKQSSLRAASSISIVRPVNTVAPKPKVNNALPTTYSYFKAHSSGNLQFTLQDQGIFNSGCSRHMTGNKSYLLDYQEIDGGFVAFGGSPKGGKITGKGKIRTGKLDFEDVYFVKELKFNLFSVSQMCDKKNSVLFTETECLVLSPDFKLLDESQVLLKVLRHDNMYNFDLKNVVPSGGLTCLFAKATIDESNLWHRRLGHINFKTMNKLVRGNLVRGLPSKLFENDHTCVACQKGKCDNGTKFKNNDMNQFCGLKGIKREFSVSRTSQQNRVAKRKNRTLIEAARIMLADSLLPTTFWAEAVNTACYVQNRVLVTNPHNKTPYYYMADEGFLVRYFIYSKAFRVFNTRTRKVEENLHIIFLENKPNVAGSGPDWLFDIDLLTNSMNYEPITIGNQTNRNTEDSVADDAGKKTTEEPANKGERNGQEKEGGASNKEGDQNVQDLRAELDNFIVQQKQGYANSTNRVSTIIPSVSAASGAYDDEDEGAEADLNNLETTMNVCPIPTTRIHKDHPKEQIIGDPLSAPQTRRMTKSTQEHVMKVWRLVDLPKDKHAIRTKWVYRNKKDERGIVVRNKARLVAQGYTQEEGIDYDEVFAHVARIEAIRLFLAYASFMGFIVYQIDVKSAFLYGTIEEEVYVCQPPGFEDPQFPDKVYKVYVDDIIFGSTKKSLCVEFEQMMHKRFQMSSMGELTFFLGLQVKQKDDGIFISQDKYVADILKKFDFVTVKTASTPIETNKALLKDEEAEDVDVHLYRSMIGSLMYLTASRPDIMFVVCACARFQVTPKVSHLHAVKRIFRYLKGQPKLGLWYPRDSPFDLEAFSDSDYAGASLDRKSTTGGCQFLGKRLISWQCKKQTIVANSTTEAEYVVAANCCGHVLWIQNQMLDYGFNFMYSKIHIDNESTTCIMKNLVFHSKTKHIEIRHHFVRDSYEKRLIQVIKIHTDHNVADLLTKEFDVSSDEFRVKTVSCKVNVARQDLVLMGEKPFNDTYETPKQTQKAFANMRRKGKSFSGTVTPLFASILVKQVVKGEGSGQPSKPQPPPSITPLYQEGQSGGPHEKVGDKVVHKELGDRVERAATIVASLDAEQNSGNILKTQSMEIPNVPLSQEIGTGGGNIPRSDEERLKTHELMDNVPPTPYDLPLPGGHTPRSDEGRLKQDELMTIVTALSEKVEGLESNLKKTKKLYATAFKKLINRVKSLEDELKFQKSKSKRRRLTLVTSENEEDLVAKAHSKQGRSLIEEMDLDAGISLVPPHDEVQGSIAAQVSTDGPEVTTVDAKLNTASTFVSTASPQRHVDTIGDDLTLAETLMEIRMSVAKSKGKAKMDKTESPRKMKQREQVQIRRDEEVAQKLQEEFDAAERQRMAQVYQAARGFTDAEWDDVLARVATDEDFVLFKQYKQGEDSLRRIKPMTPAQQKDYMSNYIKNQEEGEEQSAEKEKELSEEELQKLLVVVLVEELVIQPLQVKYPIIDWEVYFEYTRRDDLVKLWDLVKESVEN
ncbi:putative ribonuclease H-like domain-containing protein [Tanacetum coccineum]